jgi:arylsulfatase A-like enzyme
MSKTKLCLIIFALVLLSSCRTEQAVYDFREEATYAQEQGGIFAVDLLRPEGDPYVMGGWSTVRIDGTRLGVYPISRLKIPVFDKETKYLFFRCQPFARDEIPAKGFRFRMRNKNIAQVELENEDETLIKVALLPGRLEWGENVLQIHHILDEEIKGRINREKNKRIRTAVFYEMLLSSHPEYEMTKKFIEAKQRVESQHSDILIQKVPSVLDFFVELHPEARLDARYEFIAADPSRQQDASALTISLTQEGKKEHTIFQVPLDQNESKGNVQLPLHVEAKSVSRLRIRAGEGDEWDSFKGLLVWKKSAIMLKPEKKLKPAEMGEDFLTWKRSLSDRNTVLIILDAARADHFSSYGYWRPTTPNLDKFAEEAVLFTDAYSEALTTRASMGTLFTGFPLTVLSLHSITSQIPEELTTLAQMFQKKMIKTTGFAGVGNVSSSFGFGRGFDQYFELYREEEFYRKSQEYLPYVLPWLESNKDNRFFLYVHFKEPHAAYSPLPPFKGMFTGAYEESVDLSVHLNPIADTLTDGQIEFIRAGYDENLASVDSVVGEILEKMRSLGILDQSIVIVTADHGELLGEKDSIFGHGGYFGEGGMHIPLFIRFPKSQGIEYPAQVHALVKTSDLLATLADIHDFDLQNDLILGESLLPLLWDPAAEVNPFMISEKRGTPGYCYRTKKHKLIYWMENAPIEFYDLENDPDAMKNVYEQNQILAHYYLTILKKWITSQTLIRDALLKGDPSVREIDMKQIDEKTLENLRALGYIK